MKTRPCRPMWRRVLLHPVAGVCVVIAWCWCCVWLIDAAHRRDHTLHGLEWTSDFRGSLSSEVRDLWLRGGLFELAGPEGYGTLEYSEDRDFILIDPPFTPEFWSHWVLVEWTEIRSGLVAPTRSRSTFSASHHSVVISNTPSMPTERLVGRGTPPRYFRDGVEELQHGYEAYSGFDLPDGRFRALIVRGDAPSPTTPLHDFGVNWSIPQTTVERVLWWGYAMNVFLLIGPVWAWWCVRETRRSTPWRLLYRKAWQCWGCGYDLRSTDGAAPCPECGASDPS